MPHRNRQHRTSYDIPGHAHELTFSCYHKYPFLNADRCRQWIAEAIDQARLNQSFWVWAYVIMPDHMHVIVYPFGEKYKVARILEEIKRPVGSKAIEFLRETNSPWLARLSRKRGQRTESVFWQSGGGYDRNITSPRTLLRMIDYLHENPLRKQLVTDPSEWRWSSAAHYAGGPSPIRIDPIPPEWLVVET